MIFLWFTAGCLVASFAGALVLAVLGARDRRKRPVEPSICPSYRSCEDIWEDR